MHSLPGGSCLISESVYLSTKQDRAGLDWTRLDWARRVVVTQTSPCWAAFPPQVSCSGWGGTLGKGWGPSSGQ